ncbi:uncharacterized protein FTJAE_11511 [Fusarium tjaetaba]|uniref:Uncharacterized protein n=1 Tax=Fusarium tjaetaba TaxID=1567544 RepID=A0A8H5QW37_9HYPO|nr:uncharacterized protein FTJAE_11511 [Fusarium tjaetaba]KAF5620886.1 hypothetical protein FTJAE_11511 [Fusarium tjaetaba]
MGTKRRGSELDHEAKRIKSDDDKSDDEVSSSNCVQTTPALPHQPIADLDDLPQMARDQFNLLLQALGEVAPESLYKVSILDQINAINSNVGRPTFKYKPPDITILLGRQHKIDDTHDCEKTGCIEFYVKAKTLPYGNGYFRVEEKEFRMIMGDGSSSPYCDENHGGSTFTQTPWKEEYRLKVKSLARKAIVSYNREVLGYWVRKIVHAELLIPRIEGREHARGEFLSGNVVWIAGSQNTLGFRG